MLDISKIAISEDITLRDYQKESKEKIYSLWQNHQSVMLQMPTGTGKTRIFASIVKDLHNTGAKLGIPIKVLLLAHRDELIEQISENVGQRYNVRHGIIKSTLTEEPHLPTQIASVLTLNRRLESWKQKQFDVIIIDEAHHAIADTYIKICNAFPSAKILGVTATPYRLSGAGFTSVFEQVIISPAVHNFIRNGFLCDYDYYSVRPTSEIQQIVDNIHDFNVDGDYAEKSLTHFFDNARIRANLLDTYRKYANGKKGIIYTINISHNNHVCDLLNQNGIKAKAVDSNTNKKSAYRKEVVKDFRNGKIDIICNVNIFSEGFDCPDVEFIQLARPTKSFALYLQQVGRGFRKTDDKDKVIILDNVGLYNKFGLPSEEIDWNGYFEGKGGIEVRTNKTSKSSKEVHYIEEGDEPVVLISTTISDEFVSDDFEIVEDFPLITLKESVNANSAWYTYFAPLEYVEVIRIHGEPDEDHDDLVFYNHLRKIYQDGKWGIYDSNKNKILIEPTFDEIIEGDIHGRALAQKNGKYGLIRPLTGELIISIDYDEIEKIPNFNYVDKFIVRKNEKFGVIGKCDEILIPIEFVEVFLSDNGKYFFALNTDGWRIFDRKLKIIEIESLKWGRLFFNRYYAVYQNDCYGFINSENQMMLIPLICEEKMEIFHDDFLMVKSNGMFGLLSDRLEWIIYPYTQSIEFLTKGKLKVKKGDKYGIQLTNGEEILPCKYSSCDSLDDVYVVNENDRWKILYKGKEIHSAKNRHRVLAWYEKNTFKKKGKRILGMPFYPIYAASNNIDTLNKPKEVVPVVSKKEIIEYVNGINDDNKRIRLNVVARKFKYSKDRIIEILKDYDFKIPSNPNYKLSSKEYALVKKIKELES